METSAKCGRFALLEPACLVYALFYTFCLYENPSGITFFFLCAGTLLLTHLTAEGKQAEKSGGVCIYCGEEVPAGAQLKWTMLDIPPACG